MANPSAAVTQRLKPAHSCFLIPSASGYTPRHGAICWSFVGRREVEAHYPPIHRWNLRALRLDELMADVIKPIRLAAQRGEAVRVLGHSLGGLVAVEVARILASEGHIMEFVGLIDTSTFPMRWDFDNTDPERVPGHIAGEVDQPILARILRSARKGTLLRVRPGGSSGGWLKSYCTEAILRRFHRSGGCLICCTCEKRASGSVSSQPYFSTAMR